jgi:hypothetical protein
MRQTKPFKNDAQMKPVHNEQDEEESCTALDSQRARARHIRVKEALLTIAGLGCLIVGILLVLAFFIGVFLGYINIEG